MVFVRGSDESVWLDVEEFPGGFEFWGYFVDEVLWGFSCGFCCLGDLLAVFVCSCEVEDIFSLELVPAGEDVCYDFLIGMANMWFCIDVVNCCCYVTCVFHGWVNSPYNLNVMRKE